MPSYGVQKLVLINSGKYGLAEVDLHTSVHLAAPNNFGKSTLVNALQFLYINEIRRMSFPNTDEETAKHYFGKKLSYLIFECETPLGTKSLLVRGLSRLRAGSFERYIFDGGFNQNEFVDPGGAIQEFQSVQAELADRHLTKIANTDLWKVLSGKSLDKKDATGGIKILPVRNHTEYQNFCRVYSQLLTLADLDAAILRDLIISCHSRDIAEASIDIASDYKDEFELAESNEQELTFVKSIQKLVETGIAARREITELSGNLDQGIPDLWDNAGRLIVELDIHAKLESKNIKSLESQQEAQGGERLELERQLGGIEADLKNAKSERAKLHAIEKQWESYTDEMIAAMQSSASTQQAEIVEIESRIKQVERFDVRSLEAKCKNLNGQIASFQNAIVNWGDTLVLYLRENGFDNTEVEVLFRIFNPAAHCAVVGKDFRIRNKEVFIKECRSILGSVDDLQLQTKFASIDLSGFSSIEANAIGNRHDLEKQCELAKSDLKTKKLQLEVARDQKSTQADLGKRKNKLKVLEAELSEYDGFIGGRDRVNVLDAKIERLGNEITGTHEKIEECGKQISLNEVSVSKAKECLSRLITARTKIRDTFGALQREIESIDLHKELIPFVDQLAPICESELPNRKIGELLDEVNERCLAADTLNSEAATIADQRALVKQQQEEIIISSRGFSSQQVYFEDAAAEWKLLEQKTLSIDQLHTKAKNSWDNLFSRLSGRLHGILGSLKEIQNAVGRLNRGMSTYQVSNLKLVELKVVKDSQTYETITEICSQDGLFENRDEIEIAKEQLRRWIVVGKEIRLDGLFSLKIAGEQNDGSQINASSLDRVGSTGTGLTIKAMILCQLIRAIAPDTNYHLHFFIDETGRLDDPNLAATTKMAVSKSIIPITAEPKVKLESLAHPEVMVYTLGQGADGKYRIESRRSFRATRVKDTTNVEAPLP